ncbi:MAG: NAD(P)/FAD-dependent oxidoreductase [Coriobacteriia bacterium]
MRAVGVDLATPAADLPFDSLAERLKDFRLAVTGRGDASQSQVTRGGAAVSDFDAHTMESRRVPGLFAAGEALDIDGRCGGFNLHWAWASGMLAGASAARAAGAAGGTGGPGATGAAT